MSVKWEKAGEEFEELEFDLLSDFDEPEYCEQCELSNKLTGGNLPVFHHVFKCPLRKAPKKQKNWLDPLLKKFDEKFGEEIRLTKQINKLKF